MRQLLVRQIQYVYIIYTYIYTHVWPDFLCDAKMKARSVCVCVVLVRERLFLGCKSAGCRDAVTLTPPARSQSGCALLVYT